MKGKYHVRREERKRNKEKVKKCKGKLNERKLSREERKGGKNGRELRRVMES